MEEICDGVFVECSGKHWGNLGYVIIEEQAIIIDAGFSITLARELYQEVKEKANIRALFLTHVHGDHSFGICAFPKTVEVVGSAKLMENMKERMKTRYSSSNLQQFIAEEPEHLTGLEMIPPTLTFDSQLRFHFGEESVTAIWTGGHTIGSAILYFPSKSTVFVGDLLFAGMQPYGGDPSVNPDQWIQALKMILEMDWEFCVPGHGDVANHEEVRQQMNYLESTWNTIQEETNKGQTAQEMINNDEFAPFYGEENKDYRELLIEQWVKLAQKTIRTD